jgi:lipoprotein-anchoring transpeptidase ErfK/SrfK
MRQPPSIAQAFSLLCFLGAAILLVLEFVGPETQPSSPAFEDLAANESPESPDEPAQAPVASVSSAIATPSDLSFPEFSVSLANNLDNLDRFIAKTSSSSSWLSSTRSSTEPTNTEPTEEPTPEELYLEVSLSQRTLSVYHDQQPQHHYPLAVGREGWETPTGVFYVIETRKNPAWEHPLTGEVIPPGPTNPLGDRWIGFWTDGQVYIGFHGTADESNLGAAVSHGCLRLSNSDIRELYEQVEPGTPVIVRP